MKNIFAIVLLTSLIFAGCGKNGNKTSGNKSTEQETETTSNTEQTGNKSIEDAETVVIQLPTIQCGMCKKSIESAVKKVDGINEVNVVVKEKIAKINFDKSKTDLNKIEGAIVLTGYQANNQPANKDAYNKLEACCKIGGH